MEVTADLAIPIPSINAILLATLLLTCPIINAINALRIANHAFQLLLARHVGKVMYLEMEHAQKFVQKDAMNAIKHYLRFVSNA